MRYSKRALADFWDFVQERHNIYYRRFVRKWDPPWTTDPTLREFQFTNVYRELDRGSLYLIHEILAPRAGLGTIEWDAASKPQDVLFNIMIYRLFNHIPTYEFLRNTFHDRHYTRKLIPLGKWRHKEQAEILKKWRDEGNQVFTSAFTVTGQRFGGSHDKIDNICALIGMIQRELMTDPTFNEHPHNETSTRWYRIWNAKHMETAWRRVKTLPGFGGFLAYEIVIDINYAHGRWGENKFVNTGPGAYRGLAHIFKGLARGEGASAIAWLARKQPRIRHGPRMSLRNIEHSLCEYQKYVKRRKGIRTGRARTFVPSKHPLPG